MDVTDTFTVSFDKGIKLLYTGYPNEALQLFDTLLQGSDVFYEKFCCTIYKGLCQEVLGNAVLAFVYFEEAFNLHLKEEELCLIDTDYYYKAQGLKYLARGYLLLKDFERSLFYAKEARSVILDSGYSEAARFEFTHQLVNSMIAVNSTLEHLGPLVDIEVYEYLEAIKVQKNDTLRFLMLVGLMSHRGYVKSFFGKLYLQILIWNSRFRNMVYTEKQIMNVLNRPVGI